MTKVFVRPRPLAATELGDPMVHYTFDPTSAVIRLGGGEGSAATATVSAAATGLGPFAGLLPAANAACYVETIAPLLPTVRRGGTACCFAYGHTNSGKTHTIFGYGDERGLYERAIRGLFAEATAPLLLEVRCFELYNGQVFDLLDDRQPGFVREDADGVIHVRSATTIGPENEVRTQGLRARRAATPDAVIGLVREGLAHRAEGTSELHHQSSRSHAVLEIEIVTPALAAAREDLVGAQARVVPLGKARDDLYIAIQSQLYDRGDDGKYVPNGRTPGKDESARLEELQAQVRAAEAEVAAAVDRVARAKGERGIGGMLVFVDLAGAEYTGQGLARNAKGLKEAKEINTSLLALKECIRAQARGERIPYRNSKLTMLLKRHLEATNVDREPSTVMIANVSSSATHRAKALDTIKYAALVAGAFNADK